VLVFGSLGTECSGCLSETDPQNPIRYTIPHSQSDVGWKQVLIGWKLPFETPLVAILPGELCRHRLPLLLYTSQDVNFACTIDIVKWELALLDMAVILSFYLGNTGNALLNVLVSWTRA